MLPFARGGHHGGGVQRQETGTVIAVEGAADPSAAVAPVASASEERQRAVTIKSVTAGLAGVAVVGLYSNTNDRVLKLSPLVGNHMPIGAFTFVLLLAVLWNPVVGRLGRAFRFGTRELAVVLGMMLICSWIPGSSFYRYFQYEVILPWTEAKSHPAWAKEGTLDYLPARLYPLAHDPGVDPSSGEPATAEDIAKAKAYERVYGSFKTSLRVGDQPLKLSEAPYREWLPVAQYWFPLALAMGLCLIALIWLLHRQWAHHEQLSYPIASVSTALIQRSGDRLTSDIFYSRLFWGGFAPVFIIHLINYLDAWFPSYVPRIPLEAWVFDHHRIFPLLDRVQVDAICNPRLFFSVIGIAYFIPSEIGLSMGLCTLFRTVVGAEFYIVTGGAMGGADMSDTLSGAYLAYFGILLYTGRHYYARVFSRAFALKPSAPGEGQQAWAARLFLLAGAGFVWCLWAFTGLDWLMATIYGGSLIVYFLVFARIIAETGIPFLQANFDTADTITQVMGFPAVGPGAIVMMVYLTGVLNPDARECVTPYVANTLKLADNVGVRVPRLLGLGVLATVAALVIGFGATTYSIYNHGAKDEYAAGRPGFILDHATTGLSSLRETGLFETARDTHGVAKLGLVDKNSGNGRHLRWMAFGIAAVVALSLLRFRFSWWPFHPVIFLMWGTWTETLVWASFLIGWAVKESIVRFGGGRTYQSLKPLFIGMIMGEIVVVAVILMVGFVYFTLTGLPPRNTGVFPG
jgi:hypothetical protein